MPDQKEKAVASEHASIKVWVMLFLIIMVALFAFIVYRVRSNSAKNGTRLGTSGAKAAYLWNHASVEQRNMMLTAISITEGNYRDGLLELNWPALPDTVQSSLANTLQE